jgi:hypothetical protein
MSDITQRLRACWKRLDPLDLEIEAVMEASALLAEAASVLEQLDVMQQSALKAQALCKEVVAYVGEFTEYHVAQANAFAVGLRDLEKKFK